MATKTTKSPRKTSARKVRDLPARKNPKGVHFERWRHAYGCGKWFLAARDTATLEVFGTYPAQSSAPPQALQDKIRARRPDWKGFA